MIRTIIINSAFQKQLIARDQRRGFATLKEKSSDLLNDAYLKQIREIAAKQKAAGGDIWETSPQFKKELNEQMNRLAKKFNLPSSDAVSKLALEFEKPKVESSVAAFSEGKSIEQIFEDFNRSKRQYDEEQTERKAKEQQLRAKLGQQEEEFMPFPMPLKDDTNTNILAKKS